MNPLKTRALTREQIGQFIATPRGIRAFEDAQEDISSQYDAITNASFLTLATEPSLGSERVLTLPAGELVGTDGGANASYTLGLADTTVTAGSYGDASHLVRVTFDAKGRATGAQEYALNSDNMTEGAANLFFTTARARSSVSGGSGLSYNSGTGQFTAAPAGTYGAPTGSVSRTALATYTAGTTLTFSAIYTQSELTALATRLASVEAALQSVSRTLGALITDMRANGNLT